MDLAQNTSEIYGRQHGTAFFFNGEESASFLDYMQTVLQDYDSYLKGFFDGLKGKYRRRYRYMKDPIDGTNRDVTNGEEL